MNLQETLQLLDKLRAVGALRFKSPYIEIDLCKDKPATLHLPPDKSEAQPVEPEPKAPEYNQANTQKVQQLIDLLKMKDEQLVNTIFPEGA